MSVLIVMGSKSDLPVGKKAKKILDEFNVKNKMIVASAHRTPHHLIETVEKSEADVFIAIAGLSAALPGAVASHSTKPVIGVPVSGQVNLDSILSIVQMPPGIPVATVGLDRGDNAALLAIEILALSDEKLAKDLKKHRMKLQEWTLEDSKSLGG